MINLPEGVVPVTSTTTDSRIDDEVAIDDAEYQRVMRRIFHVDGGADAVVSAFNSSI
jgi:hypothetical protein